MSAHRTPVLRGFTWNAHVGRNDDQVLAMVKELLDTYSADVAVIQEASTYRDVLRQITTHRVYGGTGDRDSRSTVVLVRKGLAVPRWRLLVTRLLWWGPKHGHRHLGRTWPVVDVGRYPGPRWRVVGIHRVPGGPSGGAKGRNRPEWDLEHQSILRLAGRRSSKRRALVMAGDWNCRVEDSHPQGTARLAATIGATILPVNTTVDYLIVRGCSGTTVRRDRYGSDHPLVSFVLRHRAKPW